MRPAGGQRGECDKRHAACCMRLTLSPKRRLTRPPKGWKPPSRGILQRGRVVWRFSGGCLGVVWVVWRSRAGSAVMVAAAAAARGSGGSGVIAAALRLKLKRRCLRMKLFADVDVRETKMCRSEAEDWFRSCCGWQWQWLRPSSSSASCLELTDPLRRGVRAADVLVPENALGCHRG